MNFYELWDSDASKYLTVDPWPYRLQNEIVNHSSSGHSVRADIQGLRALAVLAVMAYHAKLPILGGFTGVDMFFVISGFVIMSSMLREIEKTGSLSLIHFFTRRVRRLFPALAVLIAIVFLISSLIESPFSGQKTTASTGLATILFSANFYLFRNSGGYFDRAAELNPLLHTWSLSVEEQFYFVFPLLVVGLVALAKATRRNVRGLLAVGLTLVSILSLLASLFIFYKTARFVSPATAARLAFYASPLRAWEFGAGALVAFIKLRWSPSGPLYFVLSAIAAALLGFSLFGIDKNSPFPGAIVMVPVAFTALAIWLGSSQQDLVARFFGSKPLKFVGDISYSLYLWHWPMIILSNAYFGESDGVSAIAASLSFIPATLSYYFVEEPIRQNKSLVGLRLATALATFMLVPAVGAALLNIGDKRPSIAKIAETRNPAFHGIYKQCHRDKDLKHYGCFFKMDDAQATVFLAGDSHAAAMSEVVHHITQNLNMNLYIRTASGCPLNEIGLERCNAFVEDTVKYIREVKPDLLIVINNSLNAEVYGQKNWINGLEKIYSELEGLNTRHLIVQTVPGEFKKDILDCVRFLNQDPSCGLMRRKDALNLRNQSIRAERALALRRGIYTVDTFETLCPTETCRQVVDGVSWYYDRDHVSLIGGRQVENVIREGIQTALKGKKILGNTTKNHPPLSAN